MRERESTGECLRADVHHVDVDNGWREREREKERQGEREYVYVYVCVCV